MKDENIENLKRITVNLSKINIRPVDESKIIDKAVAIAKYNSSYCSVYAFYRPISKIVNDQFKEK